MAGFLTKRNRRDWSLQQQEKAQKGKKRTTNGKEIMSDLFVKMLQQNSQRQSGPLIQEIGADDAELPIINPNSDEPTMLELMMAAQAEAKKDKKVEDDILQKKSTKTFGNGFKKGFLGATSDNPNKVKKETKNKAASATAPKSTTDTVNDIPTISKSNSKKEKSPFVIPEVQDALKEENPMLQQLKAGGTCQPKRSKFMIIKVSARLVYSRPGWGFSVEPHPRCWIQESKMHRSAATHAKRS